jgi:hypothetical protein
MKKNAVPIVALLVASAAIIGILGLRQHESSARRAQLRLTTATGALNALQGLPFHGDPADPVAAEVPARMRASEGQILTTLVDLDGGDSAKRSLLIAPVQLNFASLDRVYEWSAGGQKPAAAGPRLADVSQRTLVPALAQLRARSDFYAHAARTAEVESIVGSIAAIVMLLGAFWFYFTRSANVRRRERQAYAELDVAQAERKRLLVRTVQAAEDERTRIARDLHDGPIQRLTAAAFTLDLLGRKLARGERALDGLIAQVREQLTGEMESLRRLMSDLRPQLLDEGDVAAAIRDCAVGVLPPETACDVQDRTGNASLTRDLETVVYRVAREAIVNGAEARQREQADDRAHARGRHVAPDCHRRRRRLRHRQRRDSTARAPPGSDRDAGARGERRRHVGHRLDCRRGHTHRRDSPMATTDLTRWKCK